MEAECLSNKCVFSQQYLAPEVLRKEPYDRTVDWWCLGAVLYEMLHGLVSGVELNLEEMGGWISPLCGLRLLKELNEPPLLYKLKKGDANMDTRIQYIFFNKVSSTLYNILSHVLLLWCLKTAFGRGHCRKWGCYFVCASRSVVPDSL